MLRILALFLVFAATTFGSHPALAASPSHLGIQANDLVTLVWHCNSPGTPTRILSDGSRLTDFSIPPRHRLVLTDFEWRDIVQAGGIGENYIIEVHLTDNTGLQSIPYHAFIRLIQDRAYLSDHLTGGLVLDSRVTLDNDGLAPHPRLSLFSVAPGTGSVPDCSAILRGYLLR